MSHQETPVPPVPVRVKPADVAAWLHYQRWAVPRAATRFWAFILGTVVVLAALGHVLSGASLRPPSGGAAAGFVLALVVFPWQRWFGASLQARRMCRDRPELLRTRTVSAGPDGLETMDRGDRILYRWHAFTQLIDADRHLFFLMPDGGALILPRRDFPSPAASQQFFEQCRTYARAAGERPGKAGEPPWVITLGERQMAVSFDLGAEDLRALKAAAVRTRVRELVFKANANPNAVGTVLPLAFFVAVLIWRFLGPVALLPAVPMALIGTWYGLHGWVSYKLGKPLQPPGEQEVSIAPLAVTLTVPGQDRRYYAWSEIQSIDRGGGYLLFRGAPVLTIGIPERAFDDPADAEVFISRARTWMVDVPGR